MLSGTGKIWYIAGTVALRRYIAVKITSEVLRLFWSDKTALVKTGKLGLPRLFGGWNIPLGTNYAVTYALKSVLRVLDLPTGHPARQPSVYFLGAQANLFLQHTPGGPKTTQAPPFYTKVIAAYKKLTTHNSQREVEDMRNIELAQKLDETSPENLDEKQKNFPWRTLIKANVPGEAQDVTWKYGWSVLQTRTVLRRWGPTTTDKCVHCNQRETNEHAMIQCTVAKTFWFIVSRAHRQLRIRDFREDRRCPRNPLAALIITIGFYVLWINRYTAVK
ncbi:hypothetical protein HPB48_016668 [Haemaphysalis longicornis]|uniref:Reverse transcriptase zinc-binding domain-containing protein n=1 Tax=Haemaphysalis longicornis TaxID=44386 RepID=A0A9J6H155_HAELO|nr:hypothetical protein HPB48_016668 [Haemaphysalis longicornis]